MALSVLAIVCATAAGLLPAEQVRGHYAWPPQDRPGAAGLTSFAPLLLSRHIPESIEARLPCDLLVRPGLVLATARHPADARGLSVTTSGRQLRVAIGGAVIARANLPRQSGSAPGCAYRLRLEAGRWELQGGGTHAEGVHELPVVTGLFSELGRDRGPSVELTTAPYRSRSTLAQTVLRTAGLAAALGALGLVAFSGRRRRPWQVVADATRRTVRAATAADAVVFGTLLCWWVVGPAFFDDGWVMASQKNFQRAGDFSTYYDSFGVGTSLSYWLQWTENLVFRTSNSLLVLRLPALICLAATWMVCRWIFGRTRTEAGPHGWAARWALASGFVVGALAWGMTLRPEPVVALLIAGVLACTVWFLEHKTPAPLAIAAVLIVLAVTAHPAGLAAVAPLLIAGPQILPWLRTQLLTVTTIALAALALVGILAVLGSDFADFRETSTSLRTYGAETAGWRDELNRYSLLSRPFYGAPLRREWVALAMLAVLAYLLRRRRDRALDLFGASLGLAFVLMIATPSKVPWHFGSLIGLAAIALAAETARLVQDGRRTSGWHIRPFVVIAAAMLAAAWSWFPRNSWSTLDLRTLDWTLGIESRITLAKAAGAAPLVVLGFFAIVSLGRSQRSRIWNVPWRAAAWTVPIVAVPLVAFTLVVFIADIAKTDGWTLGRQNLAALTGGKLGCGLAADAHVPARSSMRALTALGDATVPASSRWLPPAPVEGLSRFTLGPSTGDATPTRSRWFRLPAGGSTGFFGVGTPQSSEVFDLEWGRVQDRAITHLGAAQVNGGFSDAALPNRADWRFYAAGDLPAPPPGANAMRFTLPPPAAAAVPGGEIGFTAPVRYSDEPLAALLRRESPSLALPDLRTYVPCVTQPRVRGTADVPGTIVGFRNSLWPLATGTSPFDGLLDLYPLVRLPLSDSQGPIDDVSIYVVDRSTPREIVAPAIELDGGT